MSPVAKNRDLKNGRQPWSQSAGAWNRLFAPVHPDRDSSAVGRIRQLSKVSRSQLIVLLAAFSIPALADTVLSRVPKGASRKLSAHTVTAGSTTQPQSVSGNICADMNGPIDTRPGTYGTAEAVEVPLVFAPPAGYAVYIDRIMGDLVAWPVAGSATNVPPAGVLAGVQLVAPANAPTCDLCAANTPLPEKLVTEANLLRLIGVQWFRVGVIPDEIRYELIGHLSAEQEREVRQAIVELLEKNPADERTFAFETWALEIAVNRSILGRSRRERREGRELLSQLPGNVPLDHLVGLRSLDSVRTSAVDFLLPRRFRRIVSQNGISQLGLRTGLRLVLTLLVVIIGFGGISYHRNRELLAEVATVANSQPDRQGMGVGGLDVTVEALLKAPILFANTFIVRDVNKVPVGMANQGLRSFCASASKTLHKYPFQAASNDDATLEEFTGLFEPSRGTVWKFAQQSLGDFAMKEGAQWKAKDPSKKPQVTSDVLGFLNRAQAIADVFYAAGGPAQFNYTLRPKLDSRLKESTLELEIDGKPFQWTTSLQHQFSWPSPPGSKDAGAVARLRTGAIVFAFASRGGIWVRSISLSTSRWRGDLR